MISKELLSEVLGIDKRLCRLDKVVDNTLFFYTFRNAGEYQNYINIYELAHKCKEWACKEGFILISYTKPYKDVKKKGYCQIHHTQDKSRENDKPFNCDFEYESIFKACQWILDNKED